MMFGRGYRGFASCFGIGAFGGGWVMPLIMIVLTIVVVIAAVLIIKRINNSSRIKSADTVIEELKKEFAKGNLTEEEYLRKKKVLNE